MTLTIKEYSDRFRDVEGKLGSYLPYNDWPVVYADRLKRMRVIVRGYFPDLQIYLKRLKDQPGFNMPIEIEDAFDRLIVPLENGDVDSVDRPLFYE